MDGRARQKSDHPLRRRAARYWPAVLTFVVGSAIAVGSTLFLRDWQDERFDVEFRRRTAEQMNFLSLDFVQAFVGDSLAGAQSLAGIYALAGTIDEQVFGEITRSQVARSSAMAQVAIAWAPRVADSARGDFERRRAAAGSKPFPITELDANGRRIVAERRQEYFPIQYMTTTDGQADYLGLDVGADPGARAALAQSRDSGQPTFFGHILGEGDDLRRPMEYLQFLPVYLGGPDQSGPEERRSNLKGYIGVITRVPTEAARQLGVSMGGIDLYLCRMQPASPDSGSRRERGAESATTPWRAMAVAAAGSPTHFEGRMEIAGANWDLVSMPRKGLLQSREKWQPWAALTFGWGLTLLLSTYLLRTAGRTAKVERLVAETTAKLDERTSDLVRINLNLERQIAERIRTEQANVRLAAFPSQNPAPVLECDFEGKIVYSNPAAHRLLEELALESVEELLPQNHIQIAEACVQRRKDRHGAEAARGDRILQWTYHFIAATETLHLYASDVTERKRAAEEKTRLETQLHHSQKMEAIGTLAGGIAHDFNNLLAGVLGYANMLKLEAEPGTRVHKAARTIEKAADRAAQLTGQLLGFARKGKLQNIPVDLHGIIREALGLISRTIDKNIKITQRLRASGAAVLGDPGQLQQVLLNLAINARDAMPEGGELKIETEIVDLVEEDCQRYADARPGRFAMIAIGDTGAGIPRAIQERVFEPFFTTKEPGKGTGMGLAMVYGIVKNHGGTVRLYSEPGQGTTVKIYLPLAENSEAIAASQSAEPIKGTGRILVVDDEEVVREMASDMLIALGYQVVSAADGGEAVDYYREHGQEIDLVVLDMVMPIMGGKECFKALREIDPDVRAVLSSGYGRDGAAQEILDEGMVGFAQKPYRMRQLSELVAGALGAAGGDDPDSTDV